MADDPANATMPMPSTMTATRTSTSVKPDRNCLIYFLRPATVKTPTVASQKLGAPSPRLGTEPAQVEPFNSVIAGHRRL
jgi:hypothetical protein